MLRAVLGALVGYLIVAVAVMALFWARFGYAPHAVPGMGFMLLATLYGFAFALLAGMVAASIGGDRWRAAVWGLIGLGVAMGIVGIVSAAGEEPLWFQLANLTALVAGAWLGGQMRVRRTRTRGEAIPGGPSR